MPKDIFRSDVQARAPFNVMRAPRQQDMRGNEQAEAEVLKGATSLLTTAAVMGLSEKAKKDAYKEQARAAFNSFRRETGRVREKFKSTELSGAADEYPEYANTVKKLVDKYRKQLAPEAQKLYERDVSEFTVGLVNESEAHLARQFIATKRYNSDQDVDLAIQEAMLNPYDEQSDLRVASAIYNREVIKGGTAGVTENETWRRAVDQATAQKYSAYLRQKVSYMSSRTGDGVFAQEFYEKNKARMTQDDRAAVENVAKQAALRDEGQALAGELFKANPENPSKGYAQLMKITDPELQKAAQTEFARMVQIDKQNLAVNRADAWEGFHQVMEDVTPGSPEMQSRVNSVKSYISNISDKMNNLGGTSTLKQQMMAALDKKIKPTPKVSDPGYLAQLNRQMDDVETFSTMNIDHSRLAPADSRSMVAAQKSMLTGDTKTVSKIRSANTDYFGTIQDVMLEKGFFKDGAAASSPEYANTVKKLVDAVSSEFVDNLMSMRQAYNQGAEFMDSNTIGNINKNREILKQRLGSYLDELKRNNPELLERPGLLWGTNPRGLKDINKQIQERNFKPVPVPQDTAPSSFAPPATRQQQQSTKTKAKRLDESFRRRLEERAKRKSE